MTNNDLRWVSFAISVGIVPDTLLFTIWLLLEVMIKVVNIGGQSFDRGVSYNSVNTERFPISVGIVPAIK